MEFCETEKSFFVSLIIQGFGISVKNLIFQKNPVNLCWSFSISAIIMCDLRRMITGNISFFFCLLWKRMSTSLLPEISVDTNYIWNKTDSCSWIAVILIKVIYRFCLDNNIILLFLFMVIDIATYEIQWKGKFYAIPSDIKVWLSTPRAQL